MTRTSSRLTMRRQHIFFKRLDIRSRINELLDCALVLVASEDAKAIFTQPFVEFLLPVLTHRSVHLPKKLLSQRTWISDTGHTMSTFPTPFDPKYGLCSGK